MDVALEIQKVKLAEIANYKTGRLNSNAAVEGGKYPFFTCSRETFRTNTWSFDCECVLLAGNNANAEYPVKYFNGKFDAYQRTYVFTAKDPSKLNIRFLYYAIELKLNLLKLLSTGAATRFLTKGILDNLEFDMPTLYVQNQIVDCLAAYDNLIENNNRRIAILEEMAQSLYREWFVKFRFPGHDQSAGETIGSAASDPEGASATDGASQNAKFIDSPLGKIPDGWEVKPIGELAEYVNRGIAPKYSEDSEEVVINQKCIRNFKIDLSIARRHINKVPNDKRVRYGDVLINSTGVGTLGRVAQVLFEPEKMTVDTHVTIVRPGPKVPIEFFGACLEYLQSHFERLGEGATGQTELKRQLISETLVVVPSSDYMDLYVETVRGNRAMTPVLLRKNENLRQQRDMLLPRLITGKLGLNGKD